MPATTPTPPGQPSTRPRRAILPLSAACLIALSGCTSPLEYDATQDLRRSIVQSARRELGDAERFPQPRLVQSPTTDELGFDEERLRILNDMAGPRSYTKDIPALSVDLLGRQQTETFPLSLQQAIEASVRTNITAQSARLTPAISAAQTLEAQAAFDWVFFTDFAWNSVDQPSRAPFIGGTPVGVNEQITQTVSYETGLRRQLISGGAIEVSQGQIYTDDSSPGTDFAPDPSSDTFIELDITQPILEGFGSDVALSQVRLSRNAERDAIQNVRATLTDVVTATETAYWQLESSYRQLRVLQRLLERGIETRNILEARLDFDVRPAEFSDAVATVESRRADIIRAENALRLASDQLKALMNDPALPVGSETLVVPIDDPVRESIEFSLLDSITSALAYRPSIAQAILDIDDASIQHTLADNARLPNLDLAFQARFQGLAEDVADSYNDITETDFVNLALSLSFEQSLGNRADEAAFRAAQLARSQSVVNYRAAVQQAVIDVKAALRNLQTNYRLIEQTRIARVAATENLRTLEVLEETTQSLTPDFLDLKFTRQEALANAELQEVIALADYNITLAEYYEALGTALERNRIAIVVPDYPGNLLPDDLPSDLPDTDVR